MQNRPYKIIVLDYEEIIAQVVCAELQSTGYEAHHLQSTLEGHEWIIDNQPDLIISDIKFPVMDGYQLIRWLKANPKTSEIPFIYCTGYADLKNAIYSKKLGASDFVSKPFDILDLFSTIARVLEQEWRPEIHPDITDKSDLQFLKWEQLRELFRLVIDNSSARMTEVKESDAWDIYFIFEQNRKLVGGLFTKPLEYNTLSHQDVYLFREWLDEQMIDNGIITGFYKEDESVNDLAGILNISVLQKDKTEEILKCARYISKTGNKKSWFENSDLIKSAPDFHKREIFYALLREVQELDGEIISLENMTCTLEMNTNGILFNSEPKNHYIMVSQSSLLRIFTKLLVKGSVRRDEFGLEAREEDYVLQLLSKLPSLKVKENTINL